MAFVSRSPDDFIWLNGLIHLWHLSESSFMLFALCNPWKTSVTKSWKCNTSQSPKCSLLPHVIWWSVISQTNVSAVMGMRWISSTRPLQEKNAVTWAATCVICPVCLITLRLYSDLIQGWWWLFRWSWTINSSRGKIFQKCRGIYCSGFVLTTSNYNNLPGGDY